MPAPAEETKIPAACPGCQSKFSLKLAFAGKRVKCPKCAAVFTAPQPEAPPPLVDPPNAPAVDEDALISGLFDDDPPAPKSSAKRPRGETLNFDDAEPVAPPPAPRPRAEPPPPRGGSWATDAPPKAAKKPRRASGGPNVFGGLVGGLVAAALGAGVWYLIGMVTGAEIGWIAWGIGALCGIGVAIGMGGEGSETGGMIAIGCALLALFFGRWLVIRAIVAKELPGLADVLEIGPDVVFKTMSPMFAVFAILAVLSAYRLGSGVGKMD